MKALALVLALSTGCILIETPAERAYNTRAGDHDQKTAAAQLTRAAWNAVRRGDCARVVRIDSQMRKIDHDYRDDVFVRNAAIARCVAVH